MSQPLIGMFCGGSASAQNYEMSTYCGLTQLPIAQIYLDPSQSWASGMWSSYYSNVIATATKGIVAVPLLVGTQPTTKLSAALSTSMTITSLPVTALPATAGMSGVLIPAGSPLSVTNGGHTQVFTTTTDANVGDNNVSITSVTPNYAYPSGQKVIVCGVTVSPQSPGDHIGNGSTPTVMTLPDVASGVWDYQFNKAFKGIAKVRPDAILRIGWELYGNYWYPWNGLAVATQHCAAYRRLVSLARAISGSFSFTWDGGAAQNGYNPMTDGAYPGDGYVDYISADVYDIYSPFGSTGWANGVVAFLTTGYNFALAHGKAYCIPEFGFWPAAKGGGGDDSAWIQAAFNWLTTKPNIGWALFFDSGSTGNTPLSGVDYPTGAVLAAQLIGRYARRSSNDLAGNRFASDNGSRKRFITS